MIRETPHEISSWLGCLLVSCAWWGIACASPSDRQAAAARYLVTENPIDVGNGIKLCVAVDGGDPHGVWWWSPGAPGCSGRSSGPTVFRGGQARVSTPGPAAETIAVFRLGTHSLTRPFIDVRLTIANGEMRVAETGARISLRERGDLDVPEMPLSR